MAFCISGKIPPPTTIIIKIPEACAVYFPKPSVARLKIQGHIIEVHNPTKTNNIALSGICVISNELPVKSGIDVITVLGTIMAQTTSNMLIAVAVISNVRDEILAATKLTNVLPINIINQYVPATKPPIAAAFNAKPAPFRLCQQYKS